MAGFKRSEWIAADPTTVFNTIIGTEHAAKITKNHVSMEQLTPGDVGVGTRYAETRLMNGKEATTELEVVGFESPSYYAVRAEVEGILTVYHYRLSAENNGTRINLEAVVTSKGVRKLLTPIVANIMKREDGDHLERVKQVVERLEKEKL